MRKNSLVSAMQTENTLTENGMVTNSSSLDSCVNLFFQIGAMRGQDKARIIAAFSKAFAEDSLTAIKLAFWGRDIRGGAGERKIFREICSYLAEKHSDIAKLNLAQIPEYGRWDDLLVFVGTALENDALVLIAEGLKANNALCAKWMPRPHVVDKTKKAQANALRKFLGLSPKEYRHLLSKMSNTVEQKMCSKNWDGIEYSKLPSKAISGYMKAFGKRDYERFTKYLDSLKKGETKINAGAVYPYDIVKNLRHGNSNGADAQWKALPNFLEGGKERLLPICDVSGSMQGVPVSGDITAMDICISLGLYISERNEGIFKDAFVTFSSNPQLQYTKGSLSDRYRQLHSAEWGMSTDLERTFAMILNQAVKHNVPAEEMPTTLIIFSDMEFNSCVRSGNDTAQKMSERMYAEAGYAMPKVVFWNLQARNDNFPVQFDKSGTALVSGFSPAILKSLLTGKDFTPRSMMMEVVNSARYENIKIN
jgi:hypothetical protein